MRFTFEDLEFVGIEDIQRNLVVADFCMFRRTRKWWKVDRFYSLVKDVDVATLLWRGCSASTTGPPESFLLVAKISQPTKHSH